MLKNFAIVHRQEILKETIVIKIPSKQQLLDLITTSRRSIILSTGHAFCHQKDNYNKKIGRKLAFERLIDQTYDFISVTDRGFGRLEFCLSDFTYDIYFTISHNSEHVKLEKALRCFRLSPLREEL